jgi:NADH pyrophosphatase NudC (nudix superfamily)
MSSKSNLNDCNDLVLEEFQAMLWSLLVRKGMCEWTVQTIFDVSQGRLKHIDWPRRIIYLSKTKLERFSKDIVYKRKVPKSHVIEVKHRQGLARLQQQLKTMVTRIEKEYRTAKHLKKSRYVICPRCGAGCMVYEAFQKLQCSSCRHVVAANQWLDYLHT